VRYGGRRTGRASRLGVTLDNVLGGRDMLRKIKEHTAPLIWAEVVGEQMAAATEVLSVSGGVLRVSTKSAVWAHELTFYKTEILRRLNVALGVPNAPVITDIHFQNRGITRKEKPHVDFETPIDEIELSPAELKQVEDSLRKIPDKDLRDKMRRARLTDLRLRTWRLDNGWVPCSRCGELCAPLPAGEAMACSRCRIWGA